LKEHPRTGPGGSRLLAVAGVCVAVQMSALVVRAESVAVRHAEGVVRGFLVLRSLQGALLAHGDLIQFSRGDRVTSRLVFHFIDGSLQDETAVFSERGHFQVVSDHLIQRGPSFPRPMDVKIDVPTGRVTVRYRDGDEDKVVDERMELPSDLANGMTLTLLKNIDPAAPSTTVTMLVATPKPRLVHLVITRDGADKFSIGGGHPSATRFRLKIEIGGLPGVVARLIGKQPRDAFVWILGGDAPGFMESESQFYDGAPLWRIELTSPTSPPLR
jgi:hypothetical protein